MNQEQADETLGMEVRTYFVRGRNALLARADFGELYVDYYLHQGQHGYQHAPLHDGILKELLAGFTLHLASRPWNEAWAWTVHMRDPLLNLFIAGDNRRGTVVGQIFTENVREDGRNLFISDVVPERGESRRSVVEFEDGRPFSTIETYYDRSEQRPARFFCLEGEDFVMVAAQPGCDMDWFNALDTEAVRTLDQSETLSLLEQRQYRWHCGCSHERMLGVLAPIMRSDAEGLFGEESVLRIGCPRCGARHTVTREALEAYISAADAGGPGDCADSPDQSDQSDQSDGNSGKHGSDGGA